MSRTSLLTVVKPFWNNTISKGSLWAIVEDSITGEDSINVDDSIIVEYRKGTTLTYEHPNSNEVTSRPFSCIYLTRFYLFLLFSIYIQSSLLQLFFLCWNHFVGNLACAIRLFFVSDNESEPGTGQVVIYYSQGGNSENKVGKQGCSRWTKWAWLSQLLLLTCSDGIIQCHEA